MSSTVTDAFKLVWSAGQVMSLRHIHGAKLDYRNIDIKCRGSDINCIGLPESSAGTLWAAAKAAGRLIKVIPLAQRSASDVQQQFKLSPRQQQQQQQNLFRVNKPEQHNSWRSYCCRSCLGSHGHYAELMRFAFAITPSDLLMRN